ncbi:hypothetical protein ASPCADRAFT_203637, partial [Aspergillus carbonarius ITEM 5010]
PWLYSSSKETCAMPPSGSPTDVVVAGLINLAHSATQDRLPSSGNYTSILDKEFNPT